MPRLLAVIREDWRYNRRTWTSPGAQALAVYRLGQWVEQRPHAPLAPVLRALCRLLASLVRHRFGIDLSSSARLGRRLAIGHQGGITIGANVSVGDDCVILQGVKIGCFSCSVDGDGVGPRIGRRVRIGARAVVDGPVQIGDGARIGPNAVVTADVQPNALAIAPPSSVSRNAGTAAPRRAPDANSRRPVEDLHRSVAADPNCPGRPDRGRGPSRQSRADTVLSNVSRSHLSAHDRMKPLIVEFAGLPGAGKTTTAQGVVGLLQAHGYRCALRPSLFRARGGRVAHRLRYWWYWIRHWRLVAAAVAYALSIRPLRLSRLWCTKHLLFLAYYQNQQQRSDYDVVLVDQSVVQAMWSTAVYGHTVDAECVQALLDAFYQAAAAGAMAFVVVDIDPATAASRVVQRPRGWWRARFDRLPRGEVKTVFIVERIALRAITEQAIDATGAPSVAIDGSGPWAANADRIAEFLEALLESGPCATRGVAVDDALRAFASPPVVGRSDRYAEHDS